VYDSFSESSVDPSGARSRPGLALAVATLAAAGLAGAVVGGLTWSYDHYSGSASAEDPTGFGLDADARSTAPGTTGAAASGSPGTPGWAETLVLPATPTGGSTASTVSGGGGGGATGSAARIGKVKPGPVPARGGTAEGTLNPGGDDSSGVLEGPWPSGSGDGSGDDSESGDGSGDDSGTGAPGDDPSGTDDSSAPGDGGSGAPDDGDNDEAGGQGDNDEGGGQGESGAPGGGPGDAGPDGGGASPTESANPSPSPAAPAARTGHGRWFVFRG